MKIFKESGIAHYKRMINWARIRDKKEMTSYYGMSKGLGEVWQGHYCLYCSINLNGFRCNKCPLQGKNGDSSTCCDGLWVKMHKSMTWGEWVKNAKKVLKYIKKNG